MMATTKEKIDRFLENPLRTVHVDAMNGLEISFYENSLFTVRFDGSDILQNRIGKQGKIFFAINIKGKKYFISIEKAILGNDFNVSFYDSKKLLFSSVKFEENDWNRKRLSLLGRRQDGKVKFGEIFLDNVILAIISRIF